MDLQKESDSCRQAFARLHHREKTIPTEEMLGGEKERQEGIKGVKKKGKK
jgi:hypothetical protein